VAFEATDDGVLAKILIPAGNNKVTVNTPVAIVVENAAHVAQVADYDPSAGAASPGTPAATPASTATASSSAPASSAIPSVARDASGRTLASPYAKRLAKESGVDLAQVAGSGPNHRIIAADVRNHSTKPTATTSATSTTSTTSAAPQSAPKMASLGAAPSFTDIPTSNIRRVIAQRLTHSKQTIPHYYLTMECSVDKMMTVREQLNAGSDGSYKLSVNDFIIKAAALALKKVPEVNSEWRDTVVRRYHNVDINVAVSAPQGLFTPLIKDADKKGLATLGADVKELAEKAKTGKISPEELSPGTFTISNLGMFGVSNFAAVINPPQACILAVGATEKRVVPNPLFKAGDTENKHQAYTTSNVISVTLSCDHRVVDGAVGAQWLQAFKSYLEDPLKLLL
jgi:pyruvate dehydrogenase E2 component (dihydrolipoamide acetyltransferase)